MSVQNSGIWPWVRRKQYLTGMGVTVHRRDREGNPDAHWETDSADQQAEPEIFGSADCCLSFCLEARPWPSPGRFATTLGFKRREQSFQTPSGDYCGIGSGTGHGRRFFAASRVDLHGYDVARLNSAYQAATHTRRRAEPDDRASCRILTDADSSLSQIPYLRMPTARSTSAISRASAVRLSGVSMWSSASSPMAASAVCSGAP